MKSGPVIPIGFCGVILLVFGLLGYLTIVGLSVPPDKSEANTGGTDTTVGTGGGDLADSNSMTAEQIEKFLTEKGSPYVNAAKTEGGTAGKFVQTATKTFNINPIILLAIFGQESTYGKYGLGRASVNKNPGNVKPSVPAEYKAEIANNIRRVDAQGNIVPLGDKSNKGKDKDGHGRYYQTKDGWMGASAKMRIRYLDEKKCTTIECFATLPGPVYAEDPNWINGVKKNITEIKEWVKNN